MGWLWAEMTFSFLAIPLILGPFLGLAELSCAKVFGAPLWQGPKSSVHIGVLFWSDTFRGSSSVPSPLGGKGRDKISCHELGQCGQTCTSALGPAGGWAGWGGGLGMADGKGF